MANTKIPVELSSTPSIVDNGDATAITINSNEQVGFGTTPPTDTHATWSQFFIGQKGSLISEKSGTGGIYGTILSDNLYIDSDTGSTANIVTNESSAYVQEAGSHKFYSQASGSAGAAVTLSEKMRIDSSGNVGLFGDDVAQTIDNYSNYTTLTLSNNTGGIIQFEDDGNAIGEIFNGTDNLSIGTTESGASLRFRTDTGTEAMRIDSSGNVGIGTSSPTQKLHVDSGDALIKSAYDSSGTTNAYMYFASRASGNWRNSTIGNTGTDLVFSTGGTGTTHTNATEKMRIDSSGEIHVNTTATINSGQFEVLAQANHQAIVGKVQTNANSVFQGFDSSGSAVFVATGAGNLTITGTLSQGSDISLKENIKPLNNQLETVKKLNPVTFDWKEDKKPYQQIGFIAQEVEKHLPELIENKDDIKRMSYGNMTAVLVKAIQEQQELIETQQTTINDLKSRIETLEG
jgi:hypothetical protein